MNLGKSGGFSYQPTLSLGFSNQTSFTIPAGAQANDFAIIANLGINMLSLPSNVATPAGWTLLGDGSNVYMRTKLFYRKLTGTDPGASVSGLLSGNAGYGGLFLLFRGLQPGYTVSATLVGVNTTSGDPAAISIPMNGKAAPALAVGLHAIAMSGSPLLQTTSASMEKVEASSALTVSYQTYNPPGPISGNLTVDVGDSANDNHLHGAYFIFT